MFAHLFAAMNDKLDEIKRLYPRAVGERKEHLNKQLDVLKAMSDSIVEHWLQFEERLADFYSDLKAANAGVDSAAPVPLAVPMPKTSSVQYKAGSSESVQAEQTAQSAPLPNGGTASKPVDGGISYSFSDDIALLISRGQGYFKLHMFGHAAVELGKAIDLSPDCQLARLFMAMTLMHMQQWDEAEKHFQILISLTEHAKWRAIGYNALGCIQAVNMNLELAEQYFLKAHHADPSFTDSMMNLKCCKERNGQLSLRFGSAELIR
ncbi:hypothetical protein [Paenibacillus xylaniclasticus]|uniref:hypothetical protein n=1 Tax=Paenibacillus xylaniclasticus TaxID=588083 RepID=UPI000FDB2069|nr:MULTISPECIES: hypothetical protein [Paenibacillus]GFN30687.1 hypothetical protein PCURB6_09470 [Paenibacillus curdlanolyticus]